MTTHTKRFHILDALRGATLLSMIAYHTMWDLVFLFGLDGARGWYTGRPGFIWQQSICITFILLSGYCTAFSRNLLKRGLIVSLCGALIMLVTAIAMPASRVVFGVLTLIGSCMILAALCALPGSKNKSSASLPAASKDLTPSGGPGASPIPFLIFLALFLLTRPINGGTLLTGTALPPALYKNLFTAYLGFPPAGFFSTDYFSLLPWAFLFFAGRSFFPLTKDLLKTHGKTGASLRLLPFLGRKSLAIYMVHQPVIYGILWLIHQ